jgi:hypothetical protein
LTLEAHCVTSPGGSLALNVFAYGDGVTLDVSGVYYDSGGPVPTPVWVYSLTFPATTSSNPFAMTRLAAVSGTSEGAGA